MKTSAYVKELQAQSVEQLQAQLVDAKKDFQLDSRMQLTS